MTMIAGIETPEQNYLLCDSHIGDGSDASIIDGQAKIHIGPGGTALVFAGFLGVGYELYSVADELLQALTEIPDDQTRRILLHEACRQLSDDFGKGCECIVALPDAVYGVSADYAVVRSNGRLIASGSGGPYLSGAYAMHNEEGPKALKEAAKRATWVSVSTAPPIYVWGTKSGFLS